MRFRLDLRRLHSQTNVPFKFHKKVAECEGCILLPSLVNNHLGLAVRFLTLMRSPSFIGATSLSQLSQ